MPKYIYTPSGIVVEVGEGKSLPGQIFQPAKEEQTKNEPIRKRKAAAPKE